MAFGGGTFGGPGGVSTATTGAYSISDILYHALRKARVTNGPGRTPSVDQISDAFYLFKVLLQAWRARGRITPYPVPTQADQLALYLWDTSADPAASTESIDLADGFVLALITNLAMDCVETFGTSHLFDGKAYDRLERSARNAKTALQQL